MSTKGFPSQIAVQTATVSCQKSLYTLRAAVGALLAQGKFGAFYANSQTKSYRKTAVKRDLSSRDKKELVT